MLADSTFTPRGFPTITMTDDSAAEREAIAKVWPLTHLLLCQFHVNQAVWRWLQQGNVRSSLNAFLPYISEHPLPKFKEV